MTLPATIFVVMISFFFGFVVGVFLAIGAMEKGFDIRRRK